VGIELIRGYEDLREGDLFNTNSGTDQTPTIARITEIGPNRFFYKEVGTSPQQSGCIEGQEAIDKLIVLRPGSRNVPELWVGREVLQIALVIRDYRMAQTHSNLKG